jgi:hypothetical protein
MHSGLAITSGLRAEGADGNRQRSTQEAGLLRWLQAEVRPVVQPSIRTSRSILRDESPRLLPANEKVRTLRQALLAEGLDIIPDPLRQFPCPKVAKMEKFRG